MYKSLEGYISKKYESPKKNFSKEYESYCPSWLKEASPTYLKSSLQSKSPAVPKTKEQKIPKKIPEKPDSQNQDDVKENPIKESKKLSLKENIAVLDDFEDANDKAVAEFETIRESFEERDPHAVMEHYNRLLAHMAEMIGHYGRLGKSRFDCLSTLRGLEEACGNGLDKACIDMACSKEPSFDLFEGLEQISDGFSKAETPDLSECATLHDVIRYLHSAAVEHVFSGRNNSDTPITRDYRFGTFSIVRHDEGKSQDILDAMTSLYKKKARKNGIEKYEIVLTDQRLMSRINLGCHFSALDARMDGDTARINLKFNNTLISRYPNAKYRGHYVGKILGKLGFTDIRVGDPEITAKVREIKRSELPGIIKETVRMLASTGDLDTTILLEGHVDEAVKMFMDGTTNIYGALKSKYSK